MFLRYAISRFKYEQDEMAYRVYVTDSIYYKGHNQMINKRFFDMLNEKVDNRNGDEIALDVMNKAGLRFKE